MDPDDFCGLVIIFVVSALVILGVYAAYKSTFANGRADHCYVSGTTLYAFVPWRTDRVLLTSDNLDNLLATAKKLNCVVR